MPSLKRYKTKYPEVFYIMGKSKGTGKPERIYYIRYRRGSRRIEEKAGRQFQDDMTAARASKIRFEKIEGKQLSNKEKRETEREQKEAEAKKWTIDRLWEEYKNQRTYSTSLKIDHSRYQNYIKLKFGDKEPKELTQL